ncbi:hypothetical protein HDZ31DRAFT_48606 [Schizophyllum fasciatum]
MSHEGPRLPPELERWIFELAVEDNRPLATTFIRVARRVKEWIEPELYRIASPLLPLDPIAQKQQQRAGGLHMFYLRAGAALVKRPHKLPDVRALLLCEDFPTDAIYSATNLESVALWPATSDLSRAQSVFFFGLSLRRLALGLQASLDLLLSFDDLPLHQTLTHLALTMPTIMVADIEWAKLSRLSSLTHLAILVSKETLTAKNIELAFRSMPSLWVLVLADLSMSLSISASEDPVIYPSVSKDLLMRVVRLPFHLFCAPEAWADDMEGRGPFTYADRIVRARKESVKQGDKEDHSQGARPVWST